MSEKEKEIEILRSDICDLEVQYDAVRAELSDFKSAKKSATEEISKQLTQVSILFSRCLKLGRIVGLHCCIENSSVGFSLVGICLV